MNCYILAGGQSRRFGRDKLLFKLNSKPTISYVVEAVLRAGLTPILVSKEPGKFEFLEGVQSLADELDFQSPVAGLYTAMNHCPEESFLLLAGDMPLIKPKLIRFLIDSYEGPITLVSIKAKLYPTLGVYSTSLIDKLRDYIEQGNRSIVGFLQRVGYKEVIEPEVASVDERLVSILNLNTPEDLREILKYLKDEDR
jgi:molybdopterin-guanine dinucleotide biosynthesis protein A